jgi:hypothetical protein
MDDTELVEPIRPAARKTLCIKPNDSGVKEICALCRAARLRAGLPISAQAIRAAPRPSLGAALSRLVLLWQFSPQSIAGNSALVACPFEEGTDEVSGPLRIPTS